MSAPVAKDVLTIFRGGDEISGLTFYGLTSPERWRGGSFPATDWPGMPIARASELHDDAWKVIVWDVALSEWPTGEQWIAAVRSTLDALLERGCVVAWVGREGYFCDPPDLFLPSCMSEGVLAALTRDGFFACPLRPDQPLAHLTDSELLELRSRSRGLAGQS